MSITNCDPTRENEVAMTELLLAKSLRSLYDPTTPPFTAEEKRFVRAQDRARRPTVPFDGR